MQPEFDTAALTAFLPWRSYHFSIRNIIVWTGIIALLVTLSWYVEDGGHRFSFGLAMVLLLVPAVLLFYRRSSYRGSWLIYPVGMDRDGIVGPGMWGTLYVPWSDVKAVATVVGSIGGGYRPIEDNLLIVRQRGGASRIPLPELTASEFEQFLVVLEGLSRLHRFRLVLGHTPEGQRWLKNRPWYEF
ncbi:hypothetical protein [Devosia salina]|uniref:PH domain-containing protein n=1 Tax=Devosia salina TaxID=2860336 RepID=A0ABX8WC66_9HYPH|nr:hypothetical protein [Devosia salina]QYO76514.1 hypothetical protein K1X15_18290 [Devosia salina]